jgi:glutathione S-transferase
MLTVHGTAVSGNCYKVQLLLELLGRPYGWNEVDIFSHDASRGGFDLDRYPALRPWLARVEALPRFVAQAR